MNLTYSIRGWAKLAVALCILSTPTFLRAEALLQLFNVSYDEIARKMPELAEAGYTALWLPPPTKGSGGLSVGYDMWDPFDLGQKDQRNTVRTRYGTEADLQHMMKVAHRFGIRVYFDNIMNHRAFDIPGFNETTPTGGEDQAETYPGVVPEDFHLRVTEDGFYRKWDNTRDWQSAWQVQNLGLSDLIDFAHETPNANFGRTEGSTHPKYSFVRDLNRPEQYDDDKDGNRIYFGWLLDQARVALGPNTSAEALRAHAKAYIQANRSAYVEDIGAYLIRAARWKIDRTKADGFRLDAVKHVPDYFFGQMSGAGKDNSDAGYLGGIQRQFNLTRGFSDANHRDSVFNEKKGRDDAMLFGEHLGQPPGYGGYVDAGMRLVDNDLRSQLNNRLGNPSATLAGLDESGSGGFSASVGVTHANSHDNDYAAMKEIQHAHYMFREGMGLIYSDGYYKAGTLGESGGAFPRHANTHFLGQFGDPRIPNILKIHNDFARGLQQGRWADADFMAYERRDNRNAFGDQISGSAADEITMVAMFNDNSAQGQARSFATSFPSGAYLYQYAEGPNGSFMGGFYKYAGELGSVVVPPGGYFVFGWRTPELSTLWPGAAITLYQNGQEVPRITVERKDGPDGDKFFNPYGLENRGYPAGVTPPEYTYRTTVPVVGSGPVTILAQADGSAENIRLKLNGGVDLNGTPTTDPAKRDFPPGIYSDVWMGYEQPFFVARQHPEKFAAVDSARSKTGSPGAETFVKTIGGSATNNPGPTNANDWNSFGGSVVAWHYHDPNGSVGGLTNTTSLQLVEGSNNLVLWSKTPAGLGGYRMFVYYTTNGTTWPEGAGGIGRGETRTAEMNWRHDQTNGATGSWWSVTNLPKPANGTSFRYKIGVYQNGAPSWWPGNPASVDYKKRMLTTFRVENFMLGSESFTDTNQNGSWDSGEGFTDTDGDGQWDPGVSFFPHNDYGRVPTLGQPYNSWPWAMQTGLSEGFHVIRARAYLPSGQGGRSLGATPLYNTFTQVFYYDAQPPEGTLLWPAGDGDTVGGSGYELVIHTDLTVEDVWFHIADGESGNDDATTKILNGNGAGFEPFTDANQDGIRQASELYTDVNGNGQYDNALAKSWGQASQVTSLNLPDKKEWRFRYNNIPANGSATITVRLHEASSTRDIDVAAGPARVTELVRTVETRGPDQRINIAWPQRDGDRVDDNYTMKVYFTKALADGTDLASLKQRFTFSIASTESGTDRGAVVQSRDNFTINYNVNDTFHELAIPLPNMYNDVADFLHTLKVTYTFPDNRKLDAIRLVKANPSTKPFVRITRPTELGSDGRPTEIILPDGPGDDRLDYTVRVESSATVTNLVLTATPPITIFEEPFTDTNANGRWDDQEPSTDTNQNNQWDAPESLTDDNGNGVWDAGETFTDANANGVWDAGESYTDLNNNGQFNPGENFFDLNGNNARDPAEPFADANNNGSRDGVNVTVNGNTKTWDHTWRITAPATYVLKATATLGSQVTETTRNARVILRQITGTDSNSSNDDDNDGLTDNIETNKQNLPAGNEETYSNGDVHVWRASGKTLPNSPDSDGDLLPDGLEVGWRLANTNVTSITADTNGDGIKNFVGDLDPPFYAVVSNHGKVPGVGSQNQGDDRTRQAAGTVTDPTNPDTDNDGISDGVEDANRNGWVDGDGVPIQPTWEPWLERAWPNDVIDAGESWTETSPTKADSDGDNLQDGFGEDKNFNGSIDGDTNANRIYNPGEQWSETDPLNRDTDGDGLPDGWENQYGLDPLDNGTDSYRTATASDGNVNNGKDGDPDNDGFTNAQELASGTHPNQPTGGGGGGGEGSIDIGTFTQWKHTDLLVLDEYNEGNSSGGADVYRSGNDTDNSRDILAFSFRDGGDLPSGDGRIYFRIDFMDLADKAWEGEVDAYIVIDTGNPGAGERSIPNEVDIVTDMRWEVVVAVYGQNSGGIYVDRDLSVNTTTETQNPVTAGGVEVRGFGGRNEVAWSSRYDAVEIAVERQQLKDAGWLGDPSTLNFQVFTTKPNTQNGVLGVGVGSGDLGGRNDIRDTIYDDYLASDWWRDQDNIRLTGKLSGYFSRSGANDRNKNAKVMLLAHGNQAIQPSSEMQKLVWSGNPGTGYARLLQTHDSYQAPLTLHLTPTTASALQWAQTSPAPSSWPSSDGPSFNAKLRNLISSNRVDLLGSTFSDHIPKYFDQAFNNDNKALAEMFLDGIYGTNAASRTVFWTPERVLDTATLNTLYDMGYRYTFADQMKHFSKWFGRSEALGTSGYRINEVNGVKLFPIHDDTSRYLEEIRDEGSAMAVRQLLSRRSRSNVQDQLVVLWKDLEDFRTHAKASSYDANVRWLASRPWIRVVTPQQILSGLVTYPRQDNGQLEGNWGVVNRTVTTPLAQTAKDWIDWASGGNYDNWYNGSSREQGLRDRAFGATNNFGRVGVDGHSHRAWQAVTNIPTTLSNSINPLRRLAGTTLHAAMFQTAFHNTPAGDQSKFSTGDFIYPENGTNQTLADFARFSHSQARFARVYERVSQWNATVGDTSLSREAADVDLDGQSEYLLFNSRVFAVFEAKGGRMTAAWIRHPSSKKVWQVAGNFAAYSGTETEDEGASNLGVSNAIVAYRTSGFKDWWAITGGSGSNNAVNATYTVTEAPSGTGWRFTQGGITKTITLPNSWTGNFTADYNLTGPSELYVRFGLSPNLLGLMINGHAHLTEPDRNTNRVSLLNQASGDTPVRAFVQTSTNSSINLAATDVVSTGFTTVDLRNQAQTQQVEVKITGTTTVIFGFDQGTDLVPPADSDGDGIPDDWERLYNSGDITTMDATTDGDGDGLKDIQEYILGSDPNNASSGRPQPQTTMTPTGFQVSFPTIPGRQYTVMYRDNLSTAGQILTSFKLEESNPVTGDGTTKSVTDTSASGTTRRFYQVEISLPHASP